MGKTTDFLRRLDEFQADVTRELERVQQELREIDVLIRQSTAEVERLAQRNVQIQNRPGVPNAPLYHAQPGRATATQAARPGTVRPLPGAVSGIGQKSLR